MWNRILFALSLCLVLFTACTNDVATPTPETAVSIEPTNNVMTPSPAITVGIEPTIDAAALVTYTENSVFVGFYTDDQCTYGKEAATLTFDMSQSCFEWTRNTEIGGARTNSITNFQCYSDRLCFTQHPGVTQCNADQPINKEYRTDACVQEPNGQQLWSKILGGTSLCPTPPPGFECPTIP